MKPKAPPASAKNTRYIHCIKYTVLICNISYLPKKNIYFKPYFYPNYDKDIIQNHCTCCVEASIAGWVGLGFPNHNTGNVSTILNYFRQLQKETRKVEAVSYKDD